MLRLRPLSRCPRRPGGSFPALPIAAQASRKPGHQAATLGLGLATRGLHVPPLYSVCGHQVTRPSLSHLKDMLSRRLGPRPVALSHGCWRPKLSPLWAASPPSGLSVQPGVCGPRVPGCVLGWSALATLDNVALYALALQPGEHMGRLPCHCHTRPLWLQARSSLRPASTKPSAHLRVITATAPGGATATPREAASLLQGSPSSCSSWGPWHGLAVLCPQPPRGTPLPPTRRGSSAGQVPLLSVHF